MSHVDIGDRLELFVDKLLIDRMNGAAQKLHAPIPAGTAIACDCPWVGCGCYFTVIKDGDLYRMYYHVGCRIESPDEAHYGCYAESADGITWTKPNLGIHEIDGSKVNNVILAGYDDPAVNFSPFIDGNPDAPPAERYKAIGGLQKTGLLGFASEDGIHWRLWRQEPVIPSDPDEFRYDSQNVAFWSQHEQCYVCYLRIWLDGIRTIARCTSDDFEHWSDLTPMSFGATPLEDLYINQTSPYFRAPHIYIALAARFVPERKVLSDEEGELYEVDRYRGVGYWQDCAETVFMTSRGGSIYDRMFMQGFVRPGVDRRNWVSRCNYAALGIVPTGTAEMSLYVKRHNQQPSAYCERMVLRTDGFVSVNAPYSGGQMVTKPLKFCGKGLAINYSTGAAGHVRVEIQDVGGNPIDGFRMEDAVPIIGDEIERAVRWKNGSDVGELSGKIVRLRFDMKDADLYSLRFR